ncbi:MAG: hypothetical protein ACRDQA_22320 [Nocardioidaceae bacterium]
MGSHWGQYGVRSSAWLDEFVAAQPRAWDTGSRDGREAIATTGAEYGRTAQRRSARRAAIEEQVRRKGLRPVESPEDLHADVWESDEELHEFLDHVYASRRADLA